MSIIIVIDWSRYKKNHKDIDHSKLLENEMNKMGHQFAIEMVSILQKHLPYIMERNDRIKT